MTEEHTPSPIAPTNSMYDLLSLDDMVASTTNPRKRFAANSLNELLTSIQAVGVLQPILVRPLPAHRVQETSHLKPRPKFEIVAGERRYRASAMAQLHRIPAMVQLLTDAQVLEIQLIENLIREDISALEEAEGYERLMQAHTPPLTAEQIAEKIGKSRAYVYARLKLINLCPEGQLAMQEGWLTPSVALLVARLPSTKVQTDALKNLRHSITGEALSAREAADLIQRQYMLRLAGAPFKITDADLLPAAGSCKACPKRTGADPDLFADVNGADVCTDVACYKAKEQAHQDAQLKTARESGAPIIEGREAKSLVPHSWTTKVEGYLRLDDAEDSPTAKPLRSIIGKLMAEEGLQPTMVANPHKAGELIACIDHATASRLLAKKGHQDQADKVQAAAEQSAQAAAEAEQRKQTEKFENAWRWDVLVATWQGMVDEPSYHSPPIAITRWVCLNYLMPHNQEHCARLCKLLGLGEVAPRQALTDWVKHIDNPDMALTLLAIFADREWRTWGAPEGRDNPALMAAAEHMRDFVDVEAIKARVRDDMAALIEAKAQAKAAREATAAQAPKAPLPLPPAAQAKGVRGGKANGKGKGGKTPAAPAAPKLSTQDAITGIAAAMQGNESGADCGPLEADQGAATAAQGFDGPAQGPDAGADRVEVGGFAVGGRVEVVAHGPWKGRVGTVVELDTDDDTVTVWIDGMGRYETPHFAPVKLQPLPPEDKATDQAGQTRVIPIEAWPFPGLKS